MHPESTLHGLPGFGGASILRPLATGPVSASWLVARGAERFVLRLDRPLARQLGLDRAAEHRVLEIAAAAGIGPWPVIADPACGLLLTRYIEGETPGTEGINDAALIAQLTTTLRRLHSLPADGPRLDLAAAAKRYAAAAASSEACELADDIAIRVNAMPRSGYRPALCHNDIHPGNMILDPAGQLLLIDWEYAAVGDAHFEFAVILCHCNLDAGLASQLTKDYRAAGGFIDDERIQRYRILYDRLRRLWALAVAANAPDAAAAPG